MLLITQCITGQFWKTEVAVLSDQVRLVACRNFGSVALFRQPITPTAHYADNPFLRQSITPTAHYSNNPLFRQPTFPTANNLAEQRIFLMTSGPGKQTTIDKTIDSKSCRRSTRTYDEI